MMDEKLLEPLRDVPLPASAVDLHRAVRDGRRHVRRRRIAATATAGLAVLAVAAAVPAVLERPDGRPALPTAASPPTTGAPVAAAPMPARAPATFGPARQYADFGWFPAGLTSRVVATGTTQLALQVSEPVNPVDHDPGKALRVDLRMVASGHDLAQEDVPDFALPPGQARTAGLQAAEPVNGRTAWWNFPIAPEARDAALRWQYAPGAWAEVIVRNAPDGGLEARTLARRIALDLRYGVNRPVRLPVRFATLPAGLKPMSYAVSTAADGGWNVQLSYGAGKRTKYGDWPLVVLMMPRAGETGDNSVLGDPDSTLDGHPARRRSGMDGGASLQIFNVQGMYVEMAVHDKATLRQLGGNLDGLFRGATFHPKIADWR